MFHGGTIKPAEGPGILLTTDGRSGVGNPRSGYPLAGTAHTVAVEALTHGPLSRRELARRLSLSPATLTRVTQALVGIGLLVETGPRAQRGLGRPSRPLDIAADSQHFIGVKLTADQVHAVLTNLRARILAAEALPLTDHRPEAVADAVAQVIDRLRPQAPALTSAGVSAGGLVDDCATLRAAAYLGWDDPVPLGELISRRAGLPVVLANDVEAWTQAERWFGDGRRAESFALLTTGVGIGYDVVTHRQPAASGDVGVGVAGHIPLDPLGPLCHQGHHGCAEAMLTSGAICSAIAVGIGRPVTYDEALELARQSHPVAARVVRGAARAYGRLLALIANLTFVPLIIVSGDGVGLALDWQDVVRAEFAAHRHPMAGPVELLIKPAPFTEWARGAAVVAIQTHVLGR
jgi:predicted NBD/HSP70 family sugar kinase